MSKKQKPTEPKPFIPKAEDKTIDMFSGVTRLEEIQAAIEDVQVTEKGFKPMSEMVEAWRNQAFEGQEWTSRNFYNGSAQQHQEHSSVSTGLNQGTTSAVSAFRLSKSNSWMYLESMRSKNAGESWYGYTGLMFPELDFWALVDVFLRSAKEKDAEVLKGKVREVFLSEK